MCHQYHYKYSVCKHSSLPSQFYECEALVDDPREERGDCRPHVTTTYTPGSCPKCADDTNIVANDGRDAGLSDTAEVEDDGESDAASSESVLVFVWMIRK